MTRGTGAFKPTRYEKDALVQLWTDRRDIATIVLYMESHGQKPRYLSDVLKFCIENIREQVKRQGIEYVESSTVATEMLEDRFNINLNPGGRGKKNYVNNLLLESGYVPEVEQLPTSQQNVVQTGSGLSAEDIERIKAKARENFGDSPDILKTREEKDNKIQQEEHDAFKNMFKIGGGFDGDEE